MGRLYFTKKIAASEFASGKRWAELVSSYSAACCSPAPPRSVRLELAKDTPADPDSAQGVKEARREARAMTAFLDGRNVLRLCGAATERAVTDVCEHDLWPAGRDEMEALRTGLRTLSMLWRGDKRMLNGR